MVEGLGGGRPESLLEPRLARCFLGDVGTLVEGWRASNIGLELGEMVLGSSVVTAKQTQKVSCCVSYLYMSVHSVGCTDT